VITINQIRYWHSKKQYYVVTGQKLFNVYLRNLSTGFQEMWHRHTVEKFSEIVTQNIELEEIKNAERPDMTDAEILRNSLEAFLQIIQEPNAGDKPN
jgi:hypothetical protein